MSPRMNNEGEYSDEDTVNPDGSLVPYSQEEIDQTRAHESANNIPSTLDGVPLAEGVTNGDAGAELVAIEALADESEDDSAADLDE